MMGHTAKTTHIVQAPSANLYFDNVLQCNAAKVLPGEYHISQEDIAIVTVLGSCVAACIRDPGNGIGGMNHFMLPDAASQDALTSEPARYGTYAMEVLINQLVKAGARRSALQAKVFGGANVIPGMTQVSVGQRNADFVLDFLKTEGIPVIARDLQDVCPRKVAFFPRSGVVRLKRLTEDFNHQLLERERTYRNRFKVEPIAGEVELFG